MGKENIESRKGMKSNLEAQPVLSFFEVGGGGRDRGVDQQRAGLGAGPRALTRPDVCN